MPLPVEYKAQFTPLTNANGDAEQGSGILVDFNPESLELTLENTTEEGENDQPAQHVTDTKGTLNMTLQFDASREGEDVRLRTEQLAVLMNPGLVSGGSSGGQAGQRRLNMPILVAFEWGTFQFTGYISAFKETIDYWSREGVPLRSSVALTMTQQSLALEEPSDAESVRQAIAERLGGLSDPIDDDFPDLEDEEDDSGADEDEDDDDSSEDAAEDDDNSFLNALESLNDIIPKGPVGFALGAGGGLGFGLGLSAGIGVDIGVGIGISAGAGIGIGIGGGIGVGLGGGVGIGAGAGVSAGAGAALGAGASAGAGAGLSAGAAAGGGVGLGAGAGASASAGASFGASAGAGIGATASAGAGVGASASASFGASAATGTGFSAAASTSASSAAAGKGAAADAAVPIALASAAARYQFRSDPAVAASVGPAFGSGSTSLAAFAGLSTRPPSKRKQAILPKQAQGMSLLADEQVGIGGTVSSQQSVSFRAFGSNGGDA